MSLPKIPVRFMRTHPNAKQPTYAKSGDSGADLYTVEDVCLYPQETKVLDTGIAFEIPDGYEIQVRLRSGVSAKMPIIMVNAPATIDNGYRGPIGVIVRNIGNSPVVLMAGERIAQAVFCPVVQADLEECEEINKSTDRGTGGYGHSGK